MRTAYFDEEETKHIQNFIRRHKYPSNKELTQKLEYCLDSMPNDHQQKMFYMDVYAEFGHFQYEMSKIIYENIYNPETVKKCGENINKKNGFKGLQAVFYMIIWFSPFRNATDDEMRYVPKHIETMWNGIGEWRA
jgi:hypothetical protein